jgi:hypothetical protein
MATKTKRRNDLDKAIKEIEQGNAWDEGDEVIHVEVKKPLDKVIPVRFSADKWRRLGERRESLTLARLRWSACGYWSDCASELRLCVSHRH